MEGKRTVRVKLDVPEDRLADLQATIRQFNDAANYTVEYGRNDDGWFARDECGYQFDGDYTAAKNIGFKLLTVPEGKRPSGLGDGQLALKSGTLNLSDGLTSAEIRLEEESTGKPTTSVVGR